MGVWSRWFSNKEGINKQLRDEKFILLQEIKKAHLEWTTAQLRFDFVLEKEQIDYAVYALEAAERRFVMLIRQARRMNMTSSDVRMERALEVSGS